MAEQFLILHKVRGAPAFDIAERCEDMGTGGDPGPWWILPTSGHRCYPVASWLLSELTNGVGGPIEQYDWSSVPDHYEVRVAPYRAQNPPAEPKAKPKATLADLDRLL